MQINKFGITLSTLAEEDIELVRKKRNSEMILNTMHYRETITPEMQQQWYDKIKTETLGLYFIIHYNSKKIGLINGKNIDSDSQSSEGGFFIWETEYWGTLIPVMTSIIMLDYTFLLNDYKNNYIKVLKSNSNAIFYNKQLGYEAVEKFSDDGESQYYILTKEKYLTNANKFRKSIGNVTGDQTPLTLENIDFNDTEDDELRRVYPLLKEFQQQQMLSILKLTKRTIF